jgi:hypothetical protein
MPRYQVTVLDTAHRRVIVHVPAQDREEAEQKVFEAEYFVQGAPFQTILEVEELPSS